MLFNEVDFLDRFEKAAKADFKAVEYLFPMPGERATGGKAWDLRLDSGASQSSRRRLEQG